jgi:chromosome segregation ATPase
MGHSKSPVDELVDGIDAIGTILDENLPQIKSQIEDLGRRLTENTNDLAETRRALKDIMEDARELGKTVVNIDIHIEEILGTIAALTRRLDQLQQSILDLTTIVESTAPDSELADTVKGLEDRLKWLEGKPIEP